MSKADVQAAVERGAAFLDEKCGDDWHTRINTRTLNQASGFDCVVAQLHHDSYSDGLVSLFGGTVWDDRYAQAKRHAFTGDNDNWTTAMWRELILKRLAEAATPTLRDSVVLVLSNEDAAWLKGTLALEPLERRGTTRRRILEALGHVEPPKYAVVSANATGTDETVWFVRERKNDTLRAVYASLSKSECEATAAALDKHGTMGS